MSNGRVRVEAENLADLLARFRQGDRAATNRLITIFYPDLRRMAAAHMRSERAEHSWQPTILVNELYLQLLKIKTAGPNATTATGGQGEREAFFGLAAHVMKRLLIHHARPLASRAVKVPVTDALDDDTPNAGDLHTIESLLARLGDIDPRLRRVVEMRVFEGQSMEEIAASLGCSRRSIDRYWSFARQWLQQQFAN